jgi:PAS domain S-box-containing protein
MIEPKPDFSNFSSEDLENRLECEIKKHQETKERLQGIFNYSLNLAAILDGAGNIIYAGPAISKLLGFSQGDFKGKGIFNFICEKDRVKAKEIFNHVISESKEPISFEADFLCGEGAQRTIEIRLENRLNDGYVNGIIMNGIDVTERKKEEAAFRENYKELADLKSALDSSAIIARTDRFGVITQVNEKFCQISGYSEAELIGKTHRVINSGYHPKEFFAGMWQTITAGKVWRGEIRNKAKNGAYYWVDTTITPFMDDEGKPFEFIAIRYDITARKKAEEAIRESEKRYSDMINNIPDALWQADENGNFIYMSENIQRLSGYTPEELINSKITFWINIIHHDDRRRVFSAFKDFFEKNDKFEIDYRIKKKSGEWSWIHMRAVNVIVNNDIKTAAGIIMDINDRKKAEIELEKSRNELKDINYQKDKFFSIISHDLRSPFTGLMGFASFLLSEMDSLSQEEIKEYLSQINKTTSNIYNLLNNLLEWSRVQIGRMEYQPANISLLEKARITVNLLSANAAKKNIELEMNIDPHISVFADENMLRSILQNIISNAIKFTNSGGKVKVQAEIKGKFVEICVTDTGIGIEPEALNKIFKMEVNHTTRGTHNEAGAGIGLMLTKELVEKHGGKIKIQSKIGEGSKFIITIPKG